MTDPLAQPDEGDRTCAECGRDCEPEPITTDEGIRISFICPDRSIVTWSRLR